MVDEYRKLAERLRDLAREHQAYRADSINLCAAETITSTLVREMMANDLARRYWNEAGHYAGGRYILEIESLCVNLAKQLFRAAEVLILPLSGHLAVMASLWGLTRQGDIVLTPPAQYGGYPISGFARKSNLKVVDFPFDDEEWSLKLSDCVRLVYELRPKVLILGSSEFLFPHPVRELSSVARQVRSSILYDGAHVLGLIAGGVFQDPLGEGSQVLCGSTSKTFPGPHRGIILFSREGLEFFTEVKKTLVPPPFLQSTHHVHHVAGLAIALCEMLAFGKEYAEQVVANAQALSSRLIRRNIKLLGRRITQSHQVLLDCGGIGSSLALSTMLKLERANIMADSVVRFGTQIPTRLGMKEPEMQVLGELIADVVQDVRAPEDVRKRVIELARSFRRVHYSFEKGEDAYVYLVRMGGEHQVR
jgi:glycine hydroxymethyltransferase